MLVVGLRVRVPFTVKIKSPREKERSTSLAQTNPTVDGGWHASGHVEVFYIDYLRVRPKTTLVQY